MLVPHGPLSFKEIQFISYFAGDVGFKILKLQTNFAQNILFICCNFFSEIMVICLHLKHVSIGFNMHHHLRFQNGYNHLCNSTSFYFLSKTVEGSRAM